MNLVQLKEELVEWEVLGKINTRMKLILSPAKLMSLEDAHKLPFEFTQPTFIKQAKQIHQVIKKKNADEIAKLMSLSPALSVLNYERNQNWKLNPNDEESIAAIFAFKGEVYRGLDANSLNNKELEYAQQHLYMLSGWYGILKPFDRIMEYRLEMGTKISIKNSFNLSNFWKKNITKFIDKELDEKEILVNLASAEYSKAIDFKKLNRTIIDVEFKEFRNGKYQSIMSFFKNARGTFARYIIQNQLKTVDELMLFNQDNYSFNEQLSSEKKLVFSRSS